MTPPKSVQLAARNMGGIVLLCVRFSCDARPFVSRCPSSPDCPHRACSSIFFLLAWLSRRAHAVPQDFLGPPALSDDEGTDDDDAAASILGSADLAGAPASFTDDAMAIPAAGPSVAGVAVRAASAQRAATRGRWYRVAPMIWIRARRADVTRVMDTVQSWKAVRENDEGLRWRGIEGKEGGRHVPICSDAPKGTLMQIAIHAAPHPADFPITPPSQSGIFADHAGASGGTTAGQFAPSKIGALRDAVRGLLAQMTAPSAPSTTPALAAPAAAPAALVRAPSRISAAAVERNKAVILRKVPGAVALRVHFKAWC